MKYFLFTVSNLLLFHFQTFSQANCGMGPEVASLRSNNPGWARNYDEQGASLQAIASSYRQLNMRTADRKTSTISPIPVIFHIIVSSAQYTQMGGTTGIQQRVDSQIAVLNRDFNRQNPDSTMIPSLWSPLFGNAGIQFGLAHTAPNGYGTPGYEILISDYSFLSGANGDYSDAKYAANGLPAWDNTSYLNVWCINFSDDPELLGITTPKSFTGTGGLPAAEEGICINYLALGTQTTPALTFLSGGNYAEGRTLTHHCGHFFEIRHTSGDDAGLCPWYVSGTTCAGGGTGRDDGIADTPPEGDNVYGNPAYSIPGGTYNDCCKDSSSVDVQPIGIPCLDFMDLTDDNAKHLFTPDQAAVMASTVLVPPGTGIIGENYPLTQHPNLLNWPADAAVRNAGAAKSFNVFPNPTNGIVNISLDVTGQLQQIVISNVVGQTVVTSLITGPQKDIYSINLSGMSAGIYFIRCNFASGSITRKIFLQ